MEPSTIAHCWVKSIVLPSALTMDVTAVHGEYRLQSPSIPTDINSVVAQMAGCCFGERAFARTPAADRQTVAERWLSAEEDESVLAVSADSIVFEQEGSSDSSLDCYHVIPFSLLLGVRTKNCALHVPE